MNLIALDHVCDLEASRVLYGMGPTDLLKYADDFVVWVAQLGRREGQWMRNPPK